MARRETLDAPRIRFNWGFHAGVAAQQTGQREPWESIRRDGSHPFDKHYDAGFRAGRDAVKLGAATDTSDAAWIALPSR